MKINSSAIARCLSLLSMLSCTPMALAQQQTSETQTDTQSSPANNVQTQHCGVIVTVAEHVCRNVNDDQLPTDVDKYEVWDRNHKDSPEEKDLKVVNVQGYFGPTGGTLTLKVAGNVAAIVCPLPYDQTDGKETIYWSDDKKVARYPQDNHRELTWTRGISEDKNFNYTLYIEGVETSEAPLDVTFHAEVKSPAGRIGNISYIAASATNYASTAVYEIDMDVDSLNDNADPYSADGFDDEEDRIEASEKEENGVKKPGKIVIGIPHENFDFDIIPDYADATIEKRKFVPIKLHLKQPFKIDESTVKLEFEESKPNLAVAPAAGQPQVIPALSKGGLRLWKKNADKTRKNSDHIEAGIEHKWSDIIKDAETVTSDQREVILYVEYIDKETPEAAGKKNVAITAKDKLGEAKDEVHVSLTALVIIAHKRGTLNAPGAKIPLGTGEFGYETVMMENGNSQSAADSTKRDCELSGNLNEYRKAKDNDLVKVVLKFPANMKISGASLKLLHEGMQVDAKKKSPKDAVTAIGPSLLKFYKEDGTHINNPELDLQIPDLANPPAGRYLSKIITHGEVTIFIEGLDKFGGLPKLQCDRLGGARLRWEFQKNTTKGEVHLLVYRGGFLRFVQTGKGLIGQLEFRDGKGRVRHEWGGYKKEFQKDETDNGTLIASWEARSGKTEGGEYNENWNYGATPPGWYRVESKNGATPEDKIKGSGAQKVIRQGAFSRWKQDDETDPDKRYKGNYVYRASEPRDAAIGEPTSIRFQYNLVPIRAKGAQTVAEGTEGSILKIPEAQNRNEIQIHPDGKCDGTAGCVGIQKYNDCVEVKDALQRYNTLKIKVELTTNN